MDRFTKKLYIICYMLFEDLLHKISDSIFRFLNLLILLNKKYIPGSSMVKKQSANAGDLGSILGSRRSPGVGNSTHSSILAWDIPRTEESSRLQSRGSQKS